MLRPFVAYLRAYEPLSAFGDPPNDRLVKAVEAAKLTRAGAAEREQHLWLKSQISIPPRLLPAELPDGAPSASANTDVLVLDAADVPGGHDSEPLVCPLELRVRSAAALVGFLGEDEPALQATVLDEAGMSAEQIRNRANAALRDLHGTTMHVLSTTWTVPLPWFSMVEPDERRLVLGSGQHDPAREMSWRVPIDHALGRVAEAEELVQDAFGDGGPTQILAETHRWLANFDPASVIELDYGGLVQLIDDAMLEADSSAEEVHVILDALRNGEIEQVAETFNDLREYWSELAARERFN